MDYIYSLEVWGRLNRGIVAKAYPSQSAHLQMPGGENKLEPEWPEHVQRINKILINLKAESQKTYFVIANYAQYPQLSDKELMNKARLKKTQYYARKRDGLRYIELRY